MTNNFAVIQTGGKQYKISAGEKLKVEKLGVTEGEVVIFDKVLLKCENGKVAIGTPYCAGATVEAKLVKNGHDRTKIVFKYHSKTRFRKKKGHRQLYSEAEITKI
jgi:large subunit ribosomal protein L21